MGILQRMWRTSKKSDTSRDPENTLGTSQGSEGIIGSSSVQPRNHASAHPKKFSKATSIFMLAMAKMNLINADKNTSNPDAESNDHDSVHHRRYSYIRHLGSGGNGYVNLCRDERINTLVAVKTTNQASTPNEVTVLKYLGHHGNVIEYHTSLYHPILQVQQIVFEYCPRGDMVDYVARFKDGVPEMFIWHAFKHVACGLAFLHRRGVVHGDIKLANILLTAPREGEQYPLPKIADFGSAAIKPSRRIPRGHMGTLGWQPPELFYRHGPESDMWALGCVIHSLALGYLPIQRLEIPDIAVNEWFDCNSMHVPAGTEYSDAYKEICFWMAFNPARRTRIDHQSGPKSMVYSKLLNYVMMRALDTNHYTRITASQLNLFLPTLEKIMQHLRSSGRGDLLDRFCERWEDGKYVTDSAVFSQVFDSMVSRTNEYPSMEMLKIAMGLIPLMDPREQVKASRFAAGAGI